MEKHLGGFTLAEVLITLGIIGVVAAITLPTIIAKINHTVLKNQFKTAVSIINQNVSQAKIVSGIDKFAEHCTYYNGSYVNNAECMEYLHNVMINKGNREKTAWNERDRINDNILTYNGKKKVDLSNSSGLADDGYTIRYVIRMPNGMYLNYRINGYRLLIGVDINGDKRPNRFGHDIFLFYVDNANDKLVGIKQTRQYTDEELENLDTAQWAKSYQGYPCNLESNQAGNGYGCGWYALADICPYDDTKKYFECLPR